MNADLRTLIDRVVIPALLERFRREQTASEAPSVPPLRPAA